MGRQWIAVVGAIFVLVAGAQAYACPFSTASSERPQQQTAQAQNNSTETN
jgi:hypothetical protein